jgi:hypothetical protein
MRRPSWRALAVGSCAILASTALVAAQTSTGTTDKMKSYSVEKKNEAVAYAKKLLSDLEAKIKDLERQVARDTSAAKADGQRQLKELKAQWAEVHKQLDELNRASAQTWDSTKHSFSDAYKDLQKSYEKTAAGLKK